ncbi:SurA N-terminal domain-containing protein [Sphingosinicella sp.]|uniref:SurA N-terminal domain-containing protein n=1 Tax=Sphingosinicella sp. TaxID=1917971 RepID=UPI004037B35C
MLNVVRRRATKWVAGAILFIVLLAIVITGFGTDGMGGLGSLGGGQQRAEILATVGGRSVTEQQLRDLVTRQFNQARQQNPALDMNAFLASGAFDQILNSLIVGEAVVEFGGEQGLVATQRMVDREIVNVPQFRNFAGQFDENAFRAALRNQNITEAQLREDIARSLLQRQLLGPIAIGQRVPEALAQSFANLLLERRRGAIGVVPSQALAGAINPSDAEIANFYQQNRARFAIPERRVVRFAVIGPEQVAAASQPSEQEIQAYYRQNAAQYGPRETRTLQRLVLQDRAAADAAAQQLRAGTSFDQVASSAGFSARDLTLADQTQDAFAQQAGAEGARAAFAAAAQRGTVIGPIASEGTFQVIRIEAIQSTPARPLETVRAEITAAVRQRKGTDALAALVARVEDRVANNENVDEIARAEQLNLITTPPITSTGQSFGQPFVLPPELQPLLTQAFEIEAEDPEPVVETIQANQRYALIGIGAVTSAATPPLAQIRQAVRATLVLQTASDRARAMAQAIADRINGGMPAAQAFAAAGIALPPVQQINLQRLEISRGGQQVPPPLMALFSLPQGRARILAAPNGQGWFVVHHAERTAGDASGQPQLIQTTRTQFNNSAAEEMAQQFARALEMRAGVTRNDAAIAAARRRLTGGTE